MEVVSYDVYDDSRKMFGAFAVAGIAIMLGFAAVMLPDKPSYGSRRTDR